jgi:hypothetical protein
MSQVVLEVIDAEIARVRRVVHPPRGELGWGRDVACAVDLTPSMDEVSGDRLLADAIVRRLTTRRGSLPDARAPFLRNLTYGLDVTSYLNRGVTSQEIRALATKVRSEVTKDDRIATVSVTVTPSPNGDRLDIDLRVTPRDARDAFRLVLAVTSAGVLVADLRGAR